MTAIAYCVGFAVWLFKRLLFVALVAFIARAPLPERLPDWGKWYGTARASVVSFAGKLHMPALPALPQWAKPDSNNRVVTVPPAVNDAGRRVIASARTDNGRCDIPGVVNGVPLTLQIDTGDPDPIDLPAKFVSKLGLKPGPYTEFWPGTRYGKIAKATVREIRVGDVVWLNQQGFVYSDWDYTFGSDEIPLLGLPALKAQGVHVEFEGDSCRLTVARSSAPSQCADYTLSKLRSDETLRLCEGECSGVPFCSRLTGRSAMDRLIESAR